MKGADHMLILQKPLESVAQREKDEIGNIPADIELARLPGVPKSFIIPITQDTKNAFEQKKLIYENLGIEYTCAGRPRINCVPDSKKISAILTSDSFKKGETATGTSVFAVRCEDEDVFPEIRDYQVVSRDAVDDVETEIVNHILDIKENAVFVIGSLRDNMIANPLIIEITKNEMEAPRAQYWGPSDYIDILPVPERIMRRLHTIMNIETGKVSIKATGLKKLEPPKPTEE